MAPSKRTEQSGKKYALLCLMAAPLLVGAFFVLAKTRLPDKTASPAPSTSNAPALTAGGNPIPADSTARARRLGYYCPSWDSPTNQISSTICIKLDK